MLPVVRWQILLDFLVLTVAFYAVLRWAQSARAMRIALGVVGLHALALLAPPRSGDHKLGARCFCHFGNPCLTADLSARASADFHGAR